MAGLFPDKPGIRSINFDKGAKNIQLGKDSFFSKWLEKLDIHTQKNKTEPPILHYTQIVNSKWFKNLNIRPEALKLLKENKGKVSLI